VCPYDGLERPSFEYLWSHRHFPCTFRPREERTFYRRDNLVQHLQRVHNVQSMAAMRSTVESWRADVPPLDCEDPALYYGFCEATRSTGMTILSMSAIISKRATSWYTGVSHHRGLANFVPLAGLAFHLLGAITRSCRKRLGR
jgi:hypothetical protein